MEQQQQQQQQQQDLHHAVLDGIARLTDPHPRHREERQTLIIDGFRMQPVDRDSLQYLVDFLDNSSGSSHEVTELKLSCVRLVTQPSSDGGLNVLKDFFAKSDTKLTTVSFSYTCNFGSQEDTARLLKAFETNRTVTHLNFYPVRNLMTGAALGTCISGWMHNMAQLQSIDFADCHLGTDGVRAFQSALQTNKTLRNLTLRACRFEDDGIRLIVDALVGNVTMQILDISCNNNTYACFADIIRLIETTQLKMINCCWYELFPDENAVQRFLTTLQHKNSTIQELPDLQLSRGVHFPGNEASQRATLACMNNILARNQQLNCVKLLLAPPSLATAATAAVFWNHNDA